MAGWVLLRCQAALGAADDERETYEVDQVKKELVDLSWETAPEYSPAVHSYFRYYGLNIPEAEHLFGTFSSTDYVLAAHVFRPAKSLGTVLLIHGYYDHAGVLAHIIRDLAKHGYTVAVYDQPGHGLSSGQPATITDFAEYVRVFEDFQQLCQTHLEGPIHLVAHSMGCAIATDYLLTNPPPDYVGGIIFLAPLIRSTAWHLASFGLHLAGGTLDRVPRTFRKNSSDEAFLKFMKDDPLQARDVPLQWSRALHAWNDRILKCGSSNLPLKIIQGTQDGTVDWQYNMRFLKEKFPNSAALMIKNGAHQLPNESLPVRKTVLAAIAQHLENARGLESG